MLRLPFATCCLLLAPLCLAPRALAADINKCVSPSGAVTYTDRRCEDIGATAALMRSQGGTGMPNARMHCSRNVQELMTQLSYALQTGDPNRVAELYHWTGASTRSGYGVMDRLASISGRQLMDIQVSYRQPPPPEPLMDAQGLPLSVLEQSALQAESQAMQPPRMQPVGLRVQQIATNQQVVYTNFGLRRNIGCWFISL